MPFAQVHYPFDNEQWFDTHAPADFIVEYLPQTRGWFYTLHVLSVALFDRPAFQNVICHGVLLDVDGRKLSKKLRNGLVERLKALQVPIHGTRGYPKAEVTAGGVALGEVNFQDMQSRKTPGLYFAGEILDLDGPIGGFNFQAAWSTGHAAGLHI